MDGLQLEHMKQRLWLGEVYKNMYNILKKGVIGSGHRDSKGI